MDVEGKNIVSIPQKLTVADVLSVYGVDISSVRSGGTRNRLIRSPFREERTPSFHILGDYGWVDFGDGSKGGVIDLVMRLENCDREGALRRMAEIKSGGAIATPPRREASSRRRSAPAGSTFRLVSLTPVESPALLSYASSRGISPEVLSAYCRQASVRVPSSKSLINYIAFPNSSDGFVLRSEAEGRNGKRCTGSAPSFISSAGESSGKRDSDTVAVFEGFFDFLSFIEARRRLGGGLTPGCDICVLNSVTNLCQALDYLRAHMKVELFLDNDAAGTKATEDIIRSCPGVTVSDNRAAYASHGDLNDWFRSTCFDDGHT